MTSFRLRAATVASTVLLSLAPGFIAAPLDFGGVDRVLAAPPRPTKTVQDCNDELRDKAAAIAEAGMSPSAFFHTCWWHTAPGTATPIVKDAGARTPFARPGGRRAADRDGAARGSRHRLRLTARRQRLGRRALVAMRFAPRRRVPIGRDDAYFRGRPALVLPPARAAEAAAPERALPTQVRVNIPVVGPLAMPILPVPGLAATVRAVVDHPVVPGLVTTAP